MPRSTPPPRATFFPSNDSATYRDLLLFEERLKSTALSLQKRKSRYQLFLVQLLTVITFLLWEVLASPEASLLAIPYTWLLQRLLPELYPQESIAIIHPYFTSGLLFVGVTTLVLFFASGMYSEKIAYANKYVPHANKSLRAFNIYLNVRKPPLREKFLWNPLSFFFPRPNPQPPTSPIPRSRTGTPRSSRSPSPSPDANINNTSSSSSRRSGSSINSLSTAPVPISPIPPATNPRGELIFSSRIDKSFREPYERYRAAFERRREEKERVARNEKWWEWCPVWLRILIWRTKELPQGQGHNRSLSLTPSTSLRGRNSRGGTPTPPGSGSVTRTPTPPSPGTQSGLRSETHSRERSASPSRTRPGFTLQDNTNMRTMALERSANNAPLRKRLVTLHTQTDISQ